MKKSYQLKNSSVACFLAGFVCIFGWGIGAVHLFDLDELYFAEITREMIRTGCYGQVTFNFEPLYEKPPLFFWIQAASMHLWGINEIGARFPNLVCALLTLATLYYIGKQYKGSWFGFLWMCLYATAFLPHFYFKSGIIDPIFNYFLLLAIYFLSCSATVSKAWLYGGLSIGCALLAKGPMALIIPFATLSLALFRNSISNGNFGVEAGLCSSHTLEYAAVRDCVSPKNCSLQVAFERGLLSYTWFRGRVVQLKQVILAMLVATVVLACWLVPEIWFNGWTFIKEFWSYHLLLYYHPVATHAQPWYYHYLVLFFGCFPSSLFAIGFLKEKGLSSAMGNYFAANMQALLVVVLLIFTLVGTKIVHYSAMAYFPITFFAAGFFYTRIDNKQTIHLRIRRLFLFIGLVIGSALTLMPWVMLHKTVWVSFIKNQAIRDALELSVVWNYWDSLPGLIYIIGIAYCYRLRLVPFVAIFMSINICTLALFCMCIAPKVEAYTQKEMVAFCKACKGKEVYLRTIGFKSAAPLFYADQPKRLTQPDMPWLLEGPIDKPCFFIVYKSDSALVEGYPDITYINGAGSFAFYKRLPKGKSALHIQPS